MIRRFDDYTIDKRIDIFLYAVGCRKDPRFEPILASGGEKIIPTLVRRIEEVQRAWDKYHLVNVLIRINEECKCIEKDSQEIKTLESVGRELDEDKNIPADDTYKKIYWDKVNVLKNQLRTK